MAIIKYKQFLIAIVAFIVGSIFANVVYGSSTSIESVLYFLIGGVIGAGILHLVNRKK